MNIAANKQEQWEALAKLLGLEALVDDPRFRTRADRKQNRLALNAVLEEVLKTRSAKEWEEELNALGVPSGRIVSVKEALALPQFTQRDQIGTYQLSDGREVQAIRTGVKLDGQPLKVAKGAPELGADTSDILADAGYSAEEIEAFRWDGIV